MSAFTATHENNPAGGPPPWPGRDKQVKRYYLKVKRCYLNFSDVVVVPAAPRRCQTLQLLDHNGSLKDIQHEAQGSLYSQDAYR